MLCKAGGGVYGGGCEGAGVMDEFAWLNFIQNGIRNDQLNSHWT